MPETTRFPDISGSKNNDFACYRTTYFTNIATNSCKSLKAAKRKTSLEKFQTIRITPKVLIIPEYTAGERIDKFVTIQNLSGKIQYISISNCTTNYFRLGDHVPREEFGIAPGMSREIGLWFLANDGDADAPKVFSDCIEFITREGKTFKTQLEAYPAFSALEYEEFLEINSLIIDKDATKAFLKLRDEIQNAGTTKMKAPSILERKQEILGWAMHTIELRNVGSKEIQYLLKYDINLPMVVSPATGKIEPNNSKTLSVGVLPVFVGVFETEIKVLKLIGDTIVSEKPIIVRANSIRSKGSLTTLKTKMNIFNAKEIDFGNGYCGDQLLVNTVLTNEDSFPITWSVSNIHKPVPNTPPAKGELFISNKPKFVVVPNEGILGPNETCKIEFQYLPKLKMNFSPFKNQKLNAAFQIQTCSMVLKICSDFNNGNSSKYTENHELLLKGVAKQPAVIFESSRLEFGTISPGKSTKVENILTNNDSALGCKFSISLPAHFTAIPAAGILGPKESIPITFTFKPNQLGVFAVLGTCSISPESLKTPNSEVQSKLKHVATLTLEIFGSSALEQSIIKDKTLCEELDGNSEWRAKTAHRQRYIEYIRSNFRDRKNISNDFSRSALTLPNTALPNLDTETGLIAPLLSINNTTHKGHYLTQKLNKKRIVQMLQRLSENVIINPPPLNFILAPLNWENMALKQEDLDQIFVSCGEIDFGEITAHSICTFPLNFLNMIPARYPIRIDLSKDTLEENSNYNLIFIPPILNLPWQTAGGVKIQLSSAYEGKINSTLYYIVNKRYIYGIPFTAEIVPVNLKTSASELIFKLCQFENNGPPSFDKTSSTLELGKKKTSLPALYIECGSLKFPTVKNSFKISNEGKTAASFEIEFVNLADEFNANEHLKALSGAFKLSNKKGIIKPFAHELIDVLYIPCAKETMEATIKIHVFDPEFKPKRKIRTASLVLKAESPKYECKFITSSKSPIELGQVPLYDLQMEKKFYERCVTEFSANYKGKTPIATHGVIKLKNLGTEKFHFVAYFTNERNFQRRIFPEFGIANQGQITEISIETFPDLPGSYDDTIRIIVLGGNKSVVFPIQYKVKPSSINISSISPPLDKVVVIGSLSTTSYSVLNTGSVWSRIVFDISLFPDININLSEAQTPSIANIINRNGSNNENNSLWSRISKIDGKVVFDILPSEEVSLNLTFQPKAAVTYFTNIPFYILGSNICENVAIQTRGVESDLILSTTEIKFDNIIIPLPNKQKHKGMFKKGLLLKNTSLNRKFKWAISGLDSVTVFSVDSSNGLLEPMEEVEINFVFIPLEPGFQNCSVNLIAECLDLHSTFPITIKADANYPLLRFQPPEIFMPICPHGYETIIGFSVINFGFEPFEIKAQLPSYIDTQDIDFEILYPNGNCLNPGPEPLVCAIRFLSRRTTPFNFTAQIKIGGEVEGSIFDVVVHGGADSSIFSTSTFEITRDKTQYYWNANPSKKKKLRLFNHYEYSSPQGCFYSDKALENAAVEYWTRIEQSLEVWAGDYLSSKDSSEPLFQRLANTCGRDIMKTMTFLNSNSNQRIGTKFETTFDNKQQNVKQLKYVLDYLNARTALVSSIRPEFLLKEQDFRDIYIGKGQTGSANNGSIYSFLADHFELVSKECWGTLILQMIRIFVYGITKQNNLLSEIYVGNFSAPEAHVMAWAGNILKMEGKIKDSLTFEEFKSGEYFAALLWHHKPEYKANLTKKDYATKSLDQRVTDLLEVLDLLDQTLGSKISNFLVASNIAKGYSLDIFMLLLLLYQTLPSYTEKTVIEFEGQVQERVLRSIDIYNPRSESITYIAYVEGSNSFKLLKETLTISPRATAKFIVEMESGFAKELSAVLIIRPSSIGILSVPTMLVFALHGNVLPLEPLGRISYEGKLYDITYSANKHTIQNPFRRKGNFAISLICNTGPNCSTGMSNQWFPPPFSMNLKNVELGPNETGIVEIYYHPFQVGAHEYSIVFHDNNVGEFFYILEGIGHLPEPVDSIQFSCRAGGSFEKAIKVSQVNSPLEKAVEYYLNHSQSKTLPKKKNSQSENQLSETYRIVYSNPVFKGPTEIKFQNFIIDDNRAKYIEIPISFEPKEAGKYNGKIILESTVESDIRVYSVSGFARDEGAKIEFSFKIPIYCSITQKIPIQNPTEERWVIRANLQAENFSCPFAINIPANTGGFIPVTFSPMRTGTFSGQLSLHNLTNNQIDSFILHGLGQDPEPTEIISVHCQCRKEDPLILTVPNPADKQQEWTIVSDLPLCESPTKVTIPSKSSSEVKLILKPQISGKFAGYVRFVNPLDKSFIWYLIQLQVDPPAPESTITISSQPNKTVITEFALNNPLEIPVEFKVQLKGDGLSGDAIAQIKPNSDIKYELKYTPTGSGARNGEIKFVSPKLGEFLYSLSLETEVADRFDISHMKCNLGEFIAYPFILHNPSSDPLPVSVEISNPINFQLFENENIIRGNHSKYKFQVRENDSKLINVVYWPCSIGETEKCELIINSKIHKEVYNISGMGVFNLKIGSKTVKCQIGESTTFSPKFTNPFTRPIDFNYELKQSGKEFSVINTPTAMHLESLGSFSIPLKYEPQRMESSLAFIEVNTACGYRWIIEITGIPESLNVTPRMELKCKVRENLNQIYEIEIDHFESSMNMNNFHRIFSIDLSFPEAMENILSIKVLEITPRGNSWFVKLGVIFTPRRLMEVKGNIELVHIKRNAKWIYPIHLAAITPRCDDTIVIEGIANRKNSIIFSIKNPFTISLPFKAFFLRGSSSELQINPSIGKLSDQPHDTQLFCLEYEPTGNRKTCTNVLVIETEKFSLFYEVKATTIAKNSSARAFSQGKQVVKEYHPKV